MSVQRSPPRNYRPSSAINYGKTSFKLGLNKTALRRPASAKELFEFNNHRRNKDAWKQEELAADVNFLQKREWQTKFYNSLVQPKCLNYGEPDRMEKEKKDIALNERRAKLSNLLKEDEVKFEKERADILAKSKNQQSSKTHFYPEVEILKNRLQELKERNKEEYDKMSKKLSYEVWRKNNSEIRQAESDRLNKFVREAWIDQNQWKEDERLRQVEERRKTEKEALERSEQQEIEERKSEEDRQKKLLDWRLQLDDQMILLKKREEEEISLKVKEQELEKEKIALDEIIERRQRLIDSRKRKDLELFWARQYQLKLKNKAINIQYELLEDQKLLSDVIRKEEQNNKENENEKLEEAKWMMKVLEEQKKLEAMREKEYELLFSEEAEKTWHRREADWQRERIARDNLMKEVMFGLKKQIEDRMSRANDEITQTINDKSTLQSSIASMQNKLQQDLQNNKKKESHLTQHHFKTSLIDPTISRVDYLRRDQDISDHKKEISRLEEEMKKLWEGSYEPPRYGKKKIAW